MFEEALVAARYNRDLVEFYGLPVDRREAMIATVRSQERIKAVIDERAMRASRVKTA